MSRFQRLEFDRRHEKATSTHVQARSNTEPEALQEADLYRRRGRFEESLRCYSRALEYDRTLVVGWLGQVQMLIELGEYPEAELWSRKALELFRENGDLMAGQAHALCRRGDFTKAQSLSDAALAQREQSAYRWTVRGEIMLSYKDAREQHCFDKAQQTDGDWLVPLEIARIYVYYRQPARALARIRIAVEKAPDQAYCWYLQGTIEQELRLARGAEASFGRSLELDPKYPEPRSALLRLRKRGLTGRIRSWFGGYER